MDEEAAAADPKLPRVVGAKRLITRPRQLMDVVEGHHVAILVDGFGEHTFEGETDPTPTADIMVVDLEGGAKPIAALTISWTRVVPSLKLAERGSWQVGKLAREPEYGAVELHEPDPDFELEKVAEALLQLDRPTPEQLALPDADKPDDDDFGF
jgi:hypothetical protein